MHEDLNKNNNDTEITEDEDFLSGLCELPIKNFKGKRGGGGSNKLSLSVVNSKRNGKRITLSSGLFRALGEPEEVAISVKGHHLVVGSELPNVVESYKFSPAKETHAIYSTALVMAISEAFSLDFNERCSVTFTEIALKHFKNSKGTDVPYAIININS